ncbi:MAG: PEP-CTERM sorting domain-containing protein [Phycisphaerales bacterium]|nr:PEP-CTERM sorting domain-containing protein [Phycisphaerales bacterium]
MNTQESLKRLPGKFAISLALSLMLAAIPQVASAEILQIQLGGVDFGYDGADIVDMDTSDPDPLTNVTFLSDNVVLGVDEIGVSLDLYIPGVSNIPIGGGQVTSAAGGTIDLDLGDGENISLTLESASIVYFPDAGTIQFIFAAADGDIDAQNLPYFSMDDPVSVSFSTQIMGDIGHDGIYLTGFQSVGTGELTSVPEPATMSLLALGGLGLLRRRRKS